MNPLLTPEEVAERLAVSAKMIRAWLRDGRLPGIRLGRLWRVNPDALERFLGQAQTAQGMPPERSQIAPDARTRRGVPPAPPLPKALQKQVDESGGTRRIASLERRSWRKGKKRK